MSIGYVLIFVFRLKHCWRIMGLRVWVATDKYWSVKWRLNQLIKDAFDANGIEIPYNQVHVKEESRI